MALLDRFRPQIDRARTATEQQLAPLLARLDPLRERWAGLGTRERYQVMAIGAILGLILVVVVVKGASASLNRLQASVAKRQATLSRIDDMSDRYNSLTLQVSRLKTHTLTEPVSTYVERKAKTVGVAESIDRIQNRASQEGDFFEEEVVEIRLKKISLSKLTTFMHAVEHAGKAARVQNIEIKPTFQDPRYLDVTMEIVGYRPKTET